MEQQRREPRLPLDRKDIASAIAVVVAGRRRHPVLITAKAFRRDETRNAIAQPRMHEDRGHRSPLGRCRGDDVRPTVVVHVGKLDMRRLGRQTHEPCLFRNVDELDDAARGSVEIETDRDLGVEIDRAVEMVANDQVQSTVAIDVTCCNPGNQILATIGLPPEDPGLDLLNPAGDQMKSRFDPDTRCRPPITREIHGGDPSPSI